MKEDFHLDHIPMETTETLQEAGPPMRERIIALLVAGVVMAGAGVGIYGIHTAVTEECEGGVCDADVQVDEGAWYRDSDIELRDKRIATFFEHELEKIFQEAIENDQLEIGEEFGMSYVFEGIGFEIKLMPMIVIENDRPYLLVIANISGPEPTPFRRVATRKVPIKPEHYE